MQRYTVGMSGLSWNKKLSFLSFAVGNDSLWSGFSMIFSANLFTISWQSMKRSICVSCLIHLISVDQESTSDCDFTSLCYVLCILWDLRIVCELFIWLNTHRLRINHKLWIRIGCNFGQPSCLFDSPMSCLLSYLCKLLHEKSTRVVQDVSDDICPCNWPSPSARELTVTLFLWHQTLLKTVKNLQHLLLANTGIGDQAFLVDQLLQHPLEMTGQVSLWLTLFN